MSGAPNGEGAENSGGGTLPKIAYTIAIVLIIAYLVEVVVSWGLVGEPAEAWSRHASLLGGLEALAFSAVGAVLGVTVQRPVVKAAEKRARENERDAKAGRARIGGGPTRGKPGTTFRPRRLPRLSRWSSESTTPTLRFRAVLTNDTEVEVELAEI